MDQNSNIFSVSNEPERNNDGFFLNFQCNSLTACFQERAPANFQSNWSTACLQERVPVNFQSNWLTASLQERVPVNFQSNWSTASLQECVPVNFTTKGVQIKFTCTEGPNQIHRKALL
jgi:hypothetical protein